MGYCVRFSGQIDISPPLLGAQRDYLSLFAESRRVTRDVAVLSAHPELEFAGGALRNAVGLPQGRDGEFVISSHAARYEESYKDKSVIGAAPPANQPTSWCPWFPTAEGTRLRCDVIPRVDGFVVWLRYLIQHMFVPWQRTLNGRVVWAGDDALDYGLLAVIDNSVGTPKLLEPPVLVEPRDDEERAEATAKFKAVCHGLDPFVDDIPSPGFYSLIEPLTAARYLIGELPCPATESERRSELPSVQVARAAIAAIHESFDKPGKPPTVLRSPRRPKR